MAASSLSCSIRGCVNEFGVIDSSHLLYVCTLDDIQCKSWLAVIPKASLKPLHDKLCVCSLHFVGGSGAATDALPTIFPPVPGSSEEMITDEPSVPGPAIKIKEEPVDDYELSASGMESSECTRSPTAVKDEDESSMEVTQGTSAGPSRSRRLIPATRIKKEVEDLTNGATSSSAADDDSSSLGGGGFLRLESCSYPVKQEPLENGDEEEDEEDDEEDEEEEEEDGEEEDGEEEEGEEDENSEDVDDVDGESTVDGMMDDDAEIATPAPGSGCGVDPGPCVASSSSSAYLPPAVIKMEEFGECPAEDYEIENLVPSSSEVKVKVKTEPRDEADGEPSSADQGCQANDGTSVALMPPGFISEDAVPSSSVAVGSSMLTVGNGVLAGDTGFVISNAFSCATGTGVVDEAVRKNQATSTGRSTRTVWTQTYEPEKRTVWTQVAQLGDLKMLYHRSTQTDPWLERSPRLPKNTRRKRTYDEIAGNKKH